MCYVFDLRVTDFHLVYCLLPSWTSILLFWYRSAPFGWQLTSRLRFEPVLSLQMHCSTTHFSIKSLSLGVDLIWSLYGLIWTARLLWSPQQPVLLQEQVLPTITTIRDGSLQTWASMASSSVKMLRCANLAPMLGSVVQRKISHSVKPNYSRVALRWSKTLGSFLLKTCEFFSFK